MQMTFGQPRVALEQWRTLRMVVDARSYARAAQRMHKSQSAVTYAVQKLERLLDVQVFEIHGRRAVLTPAGHLLYRRAGVLLEEAATLEQAAGRLSAGQESEIRLAVDIVFPTWLLLQCLDRFSREQPLCSSNCRKPYWAAPSRRCCSARPIWPSAPSCHPAFSATR